MTFAEMVQFVQAQFTDGLAIVVGSGLSAAEGLPGMGPLADHLRASTLALPPDSSRWWTAVDASLQAGSGLEAALLKTPPSEDQDRWVRSETANLLMKHERSIVSEVMAGNRELKLTAFLNRILKPTHGLPIVTTNYDRLVEVACEMAGYHVDTTAVGLYGGVFDPRRSCMASCRGILQRGKITELAHFPRAIVLKPHGSFDWYMSSRGPRRCSLEVDGERLVITPGTGKFRAGYNEPFDKHRELANEHINRAARLLVVGYGFNDDHLQTHLSKRIKDGTPTLVLCRTATPALLALIQAAPSVVCLARPSSGLGVALLTRNGASDHPGPNLWQLDTLTKEVLS